MRTIKLSLFLLAISTVLFSQTIEEAWYKVPRADLTQFNRQDTLRGSITPEREWWDLVHYHLDITVDIDARAISGSNTVTYKVLNAHDLMQIDLQDPLLITEVIQDGKSLSFEKDGFVWYIQLEKKQTPGDLNSLTISYEGNPKVAERAPWDGGFSWETDDNGNPFVATSCQGLGASVWWPCKDHMYDQPDSMLISATVPRGLTAVCNGRLVGEKNVKGKMKTFHWKVHNPLSNYVVNLNIGDYAHFSEVFDGEAGKLDLDYYVLKDNLEKAKEHFKQVPMMLEAFEYWFGPYPFYEDGYKLVEVPYLGMEHQSSITYGNKYQNGYLGNDQSGSGWGLKFDFIIIHESGHEWFANNITYQDIADMWIHESFINYSECLYVEYHYGKEAGYEYERGVRRGISNHTPIIGIYDVNQKGSGDMYPKGSNMLHTIRQLLDDDEKWRGILRGLNKEFYHSTVTTAQIENFMIAQSGLDLQPIFNQYLRTAMIPTLEYFFEDGKLTYKWINCVDGFNMPVKVYIDGKEKLLKPEQKRKTEDVGEGSHTLKIDLDYYVGSMEIIEK